MTRKSRSSNRQQPKRAPTRTRKERSPAVPPNMMRNLAVSLAIAVAPSFLLGLLVWAASLGGGIVQGNMEVIVAFVLVLSLPLWTIAVAVCRK